MKKTIWSILLGAAVLTFPGVALADNVQGYICSTSYTPGSPTGAGNNGVITFTLYTGPNCTGSPIPNPLSSYYFCSTVAGGGAPSHQACSNNALYRYTSKDASAAFARLMSRLAKFDYQITLSRGPCVQGGSFCAQTISF